MFVVCVVCVIFHLIFEASAPHPAFNPRCAKGPSSLPNNVKTDHETLEGVFNFVENIENS